MTALKREFVVPLVGVQDLPGNRNLSFNKIPAPMAIWIDLDAEEEDDTPRVYVEITTRVGDLPNRLSTDAAAALGHEMLCFDVPTAAAIADLLRQRVDFDKFAIDAWDMQSDVRVKTSWDNTGVDLTLAFPEVNILLCIDDFDQVDRIAETLAECAALLSEAT